MRFNQLLNEAPPGMKVNRKMGPGEVKFLTTSEADEHIQKMASYIQKKLKAAGSDMTVHDIMLRVLSSEQLQKLKQSAKISPILYETIALNALEQGFFDAMDKIEVDEAPRFSIVVFNRLKDIIKAQHREFFPLRNHVEQKYLKNDRWIFVPDARLPADLNSIGTAAATPQGWFIFNIPFMQKLLNFAHLKGIKPKNPAFKSNGGQIPDEYGYIEFLILHELMHFTHGDFYFQKKLNGNGKIINYVGDYRTNYQLVKSGYEQLPIGLFSDHINYDRQGSYKEMYDLVKSELDKFKDKDREEMENMLDQLTDDHSQQGDPADHQPPGQEPKQKSSGDGELDDAAAAEADEAFKDAADKLKPVDKVDPNADEKVKQQSQASGSGERGGPGGKGDGTQKEIKKFEAKPTMNWKALIRKMVTSAAKFDVEDTYAKAHRRSAAGVLTARASGASAVKPGERVNAQELVKVAFIVDSSGSMSSHLSAIYTNIKMAFQATGGAVLPEFVLVKFSSGSHMYVCDMKTNKAHPLHDVREYLKGKKQAATGKATDAFEEGEQGATNFDGALVDNTKALMAAGFNVMIFTDTDILAGSNLTNFKSVIKAGSSKLFTVFVDSACYQQAVQALGVASNNFSHL